MKTVLFETLGCRLNQDETEGAARYFSLNGFLCDMKSVSASAEILAEPILCVVNTCTVTGKAEQKARRIIRLLLKKFPQSVVLVTGCYAEMDADEIQKISGRIAVLKGTGKFLLQKIAQEMNGGILDCGSGKFSVKNLSQFIAANEKKFFTAEKKSQQNSPAKNPRKNSADKIQRNKIGAENSAEEIRRNKIDAENSAEEIQRNEIDAENSADEIQRNKIGVENSAEEIQNSFLLYTPVFEKHSRASLKIQDGCNNSCSFCRVHLARGKSVSLDAKKILERVTELEKIGVNEVVLTGVNLSQYDCRVNGKNFSFAELLEFLLHETQKIKFRISSFYPQHVTEKLCAVLRNERIQPFFHLSIQSGSEKILSLMNRPYKISQVENAVELLRGCKKNPFISCDIIAGFPGETEADFCRTKNLCEKNSFAWIHAFPFSPRKGTPAASMKNQVPERTKNGRVKWLTEKAVQGKISYIKNFSGETLEAVVENLRDESKNSFGEFTFRAVTGNFLHAEFLSEKNFKPGSTIHLKIKNPLEENIRSGKETECSAEICIG